MKKLKKVTKLTDQRFLNLFSNEYDDGSTYQVASRNPNYDGSETAPAAVMMIVTNSTNTRMLITHEYRYTINDWTTSMPAGLIDEGETAEEAAIRELAEETGYTKALVVNALPATYSSVGMTDERVQPVFIQIDENEYDDQSLGESELISFEWVTKAEAGELALTCPNLTARAQLALLLFANS